MPSVQSSRQLALALARLANLRQADAGTPKASRTAPADEAQRDSIEVSIEAKALGRAEEPDATRAERLARLRQAIAEGTYEVPVDELARRFLSPSSKDRDPHLSD